MSAGSDAVRYELDGPLTYIGGGEGVEPLLGGRDGGVGVLDALRAGVDLDLGGGGVVPGGLHVQDRLVDALLLGLDRRRRVPAAAG